MIPHSANADSVLARRLGLVASALDTTIADRTLPLADQIEQVVDTTDPGQVWLVLTTLSGTFFPPERVEEVHFECTFRGARAIVDAAYHATTNETIRWPVRIARGATLLDVSATAQAPYATGIQRVVREVVSRWRARHECDLVVWTGDFRTLRLADEVERTALDAGSPPPVASVRTMRTTVVVPWEGVFVVPELFAEPIRTFPTRALVRYSRCRTGSFAFDLVPLTSPETTNNHVPGIFAEYLNALREFDVVATDSHAAAQEYRAWTTMLSAVGVPGPQIHGVPLAVEAPRPTERSLAEARDRFVVAGLPMVLVVGTHEPRKNHLAVLDAAEILWRRGARFSLTFLGGQSWGSDVFSRRLEDLQQAGRLVETARGVGDDLLWAAYQTARFSVFPSLHEGYGLPIAESLAVGTPVITSNFGSMAEIAADGGALTVDPRNPDALADAMARLLDDDDLLAELAALAGARPRRTWDQVADEAWRLLCRLDKEIQV